MSKALAAGFQSLVSRVAVSLVNNKGDIGDVLKELGSSASIKSLATSMVTAGVIAALPVDALPALGAEQAGNSVQAAAVQKLQVNIVRSAIGASINTAINGGDLGDKLLASLKTVAVQDVLSATQGAVGDYTDSTGVNDIPVLNMIGHALVGGLAAEATGGEFASGAAAGFAVIFAWPTLGKPVLDVRSPLPGRLR